MKDCIEEGEEPEEESPVPLESSESPAILPQQSEFDLLSLNKEFKDPNTTCFVSISLRKLITALPHSVDGRAGCESKRFNYLFGVIKSWQENTQGSTTPNTTVFLV